MKADDFKTKRGFVGWFLDNAGKIIAISTGVFFAAILVISYELFSHTDEIARGVGGLAREVVDGYNHAPKK